MTISNKISYLVTTELEIVIICLIANSYAYYAFVPSSDESKSHKLSSVSMFKDTCVNTKKTSGSVIRIAPTTRKRLTGSNVFTSEKFDLKSEYLQ